MSVKTIKSTCPISGTEETKLVQGRQLIIWSNKTGTDSMLRFRNSMQEEDAATFFVVGLDELKSIQAIVNEAVKQQEAKKS